MHITLVVHDLGRHGAARAVLSLAGALIGRGHRVDLVLFRSPANDWFPEKVPSEVHLFVYDRTTLRFAGHDGDVDTVPVLQENPTDGATEVLRHSRASQAAMRTLDWFRLASALNWDPLCLPHRGLTRQARAVASWMERKKPDCVLPNGPRPSAVTLLASRLLKEPPPIIPTDHNVGDSDDRRSRYLFPYASHFVAVSRGVADDLAMTVDVPGDRITTIYNPVVTPNLHIKAAETPDHPWLRNDSAPIILAAGRFEKQKDYPTLIRAFARVSVRRPCRLIILGEGSKRTEIEGLVQEFNLTDRVSLPGWAENPFAFMARASLFVLSSRWEGLPTVLVEALACGCPCVSTDCPSGPAEILQDGEFGVLVPVGDSEALAEAMERVLDAPPDRRLLQQRAAYFSADRAVAAYEDLIASVVQRSGGTSCVSS